MFGTLETCQATNTNAQPLVTIVSVPRLFVRLSRVLAREARPALRKCAWNGSAGAADEMTICFDEAVVQGRTPMETARLEEN